MAMRCSAPEVARVCCPAVLHAVAALLLLAPAGTAAQEVTGDTLVGRVIDARSRTPIPGARLILTREGAPRPAADILTGDDGRFALPGLPQGTYTVAVHAFGYAAVADRSVVYRGGIHRLDVAVLPTALELEGIDVVVTRPAVVAERTQLVSGIVLDGRADFAIPDLDVALQNVAGEVVGRTTTDREGHFVFAVGQPGLYQLRLARMGYDSAAATHIAVAPGEDVYVELRAEPTAYGLGEVRVSAPRTLPLLEATGFYHRRELGRGDFYGPAQVDSLPAVLASQLLRRLRDVTLFPGILHIRGTIGPGGKPCRPRIVLDGMELKGMSLEGMTLDELVPKNIIRAVEVYKHPGDIPQQWRGHLTCAVIAIWTE